MTPKSGSRHLRRFSGPALALLLGERVYRRYLSFPAMAL